MGICRSGSAQDRKEGPKQPAKDWKDAAACKVLRIIDGDTIEIEQDGKAVKVQLIGVDTPSRFVLAWDRLPSQWRVVHAGQRDADMVGTDRGGSHRSFLRAGVRWESKVASVGLHLRV